MGICWIGIILQRICFTTHTRKIHQTIKMNNQLEMLSQREELIEHLEAIIDDNFGLCEYKDDVIRQLSDAVCIHFPTPQS